MTETVVLREGKRATYGTILIEIEEARGGAVKLRLSTPRRHRRVRILRSRRKTTVDTSKSGD